MKDLIKEAIEKGVYSADKRLPSERALAAEYNAPQSQARKALQELVDDGYLDCRKNSGYFVRRRLPPRRRLHKVLLCQGSALYEDLKENYFTGIMFQRAAEYNLNIIARDCRPGLDAQNDLLMEAAEDGMEGILLFPQIIDKAPAALWEIRKRGITVIFWDYSPFPGVFPSVGIDHFQSCFKAAEVLSKLKEPARFIGYEGNIQSSLKREGFLAGCAAYGVKESEPFFTPYSSSAAIDQVKDRISSLREGELVFASTRLMTEAVVGLMADRGFFPGRHYKLLGTDKLKLTEGSSAQINCMSRDREKIARMLLSALQEMIERPQGIISETKISMNYLPGDTL